MIIQPLKSTLYNPYIGYYIRYEKFKVDFIPLPKNASSYIETFFDLALEKGSLEYFKCSHNKEQEIKPIIPKRTIVILRDPIERWISGATHYMYLANKRPNHELDLDTSVFKKLIKNNNLILDIHTDLQVRYLENLNTDDLLFFKLDMSLKKRIKDFLRRNLKIDDQVWKADENKINYNRAVSNLYKKKLSEQLREEVFTNKKLLDQIKKTYEPDFMLFNTVNYYNITL